MPCAVIFQNPRTPYYNIVILSNDIDDLGLLRGYAAYFCPNSEKYIWNEEEYNKKGEAFITDSSMVISDIEKLKQFKNKGVAMSIYINMVNDRLELLGTVEYGIRYFSKYAFSNHRNLHRLSLIEKEHFLDNIEGMTPQQLLLHYIKIINHRKLLVIHTLQVATSSECSIRHTDELFCLSPLSSPTNI
jgi:hypothetical protein